MTRFAALTGQSSFIADLDRPGQLYARLVRSPAPHADLLEVDTGAALELAGVVGVVTARDLGEPGRIPVRVPNRHDLSALTQHPLARDRVRYVGEPIAVVVAEDPYVAEDAMDLVFPELEPRRPSTLQRPGDEPLHASAPDNVFVSLRAAYGDVEQAFAQADLVVSQPFTLNRHSGVPLETRGLVAEYDPLAGRFTLWGTTKVPKFNRLVLADLLGVPVESIRVVDVDVGGGFGVRGEFYPEDFLVPWLARRFSRPVKWIEDRREHLLATNHSREQIHQASIALSADGTFLGLRDSIRCDMGAYIRTNGLTVPEYTLQGLPGPYRWAAFEAGIDCIASNKTPVGVYRAPGVSEATFVRERLIERAAHELDLDPADLRRRNYLAPSEFPLQLDLGDDLGVFRYDSGDIARLADELLDAAGYDSLRHGARVERSEGAAVGIGMSAFTVETGVGVTETCSAGLDADGRLKLKTGIADLGQGPCEMLVSIAAEALGIGESRIDVHFGDTDVFDQGVGSFGSRTTVLAGNAVRGAALALVERGKEVAAEALDTVPDEIVFDQGKFVSAGGEILGWDGLVERSKRTGDLTRLAVQEEFVQDELSIAGGVNLAVVEVDAETGVVDCRLLWLAYDVGRAVVPAAVAGQLIGGAVQGLGGVLLESFEFSDDAQPLATSFMDYLLPTFGEARRVRTLVGELAPSPENPLGLKGAGEGGIPGVGAAIANAVADALGAWGEVLGSPPLSPSTVWHEVLTEGRGDA